MNGKVSADFSCIGPIQIMGLLISQNASVNLKIYFGWRSCKVEKHSQHTRVLAQLFVSSLFVGHSQHYILQFCVTFFRQ